MNLEWIRILGGFLTVSIFGGLMGIGLTIASVKLKVEKDKRTSDLNDALPGINCGACGYAGCSGYADAMAKGEDSDLTKCKPGGQTTLENISQVMGVEIKEQGIKLIAQVHCLGGIKEAREKYQYDDLIDCRAAFGRFNGKKSCEYGCLGLGSCVKICPVDAISIGDNAIAFVNKEICISCGKCVDICPNHVIEMIPYDADYYIACNSKDKGKDTKSNCSVGCIGCKICEKKFPEAGFMVNDFLSRINYEKSDRHEDREEASEKCPVNCIVKA